MSEASHAAMGLAPRCRASFCSGLHKNKRFIFNSRRSVAGKSPGPCMEAD